MIKRAKYAYAFETYVSDDDMCALCAVPYDDTSLDIIDDELEKAEIEDAIYECVIDLVRSKVAKRVLARRRAAEENPDRL